VLIKGNGSSLVVDTLCDRTRGQNTPVTCFYFDFAARKEQSAATVLGSLLKQMISGTGRIPAEVLRTLREQKEATSGRRPQLVDIVKMMQLVTSAQRTYMCIDALDECTAVQRFRLFDSVVQVLEKSPSTRIFVTGRPHIRAEIEKRLPRRVTSISVGPTIGDISSYLRARLSEDETPDAMDESLEADILEKITGNISEMWVIGGDRAENPNPCYWLIDIHRFLLVSLNIDSILRESTIYRRRELLSKITDGLGLGDAYDATIERIKAQDGDKCRLGMGALMWISHAERPLRAGELCRALAVELGSTNFNPKNIPSTSTLMSCCQGLITVDKEASTVRLIHFTLKEYLSARPDIFSRPHSTMAEICLTYLNSEMVKAPSSCLFPYIPSTTFLRYSSRYWGAHAKRDLSGHGKSLVMELLQDYDGHISAKSLLAEAGYIGHMMEGTGFRFGGLHCASFFGIVEVVATMIEMKNYDINEGDFLGHTPLAWAAKNGHEGVVRILLRQVEINLGKADNGGDTPLSHAARGGNEEVVKLLLEGDKVNPDKSDNYGSTPLLHAAWGGHEGVVRALLARDGVSPDKTDDYGDTPLSQAARGGYGGVVRAILERGDVNPDKPAHRGRTPLHNAARGGHEAVVKILLAQDEVNPDKADNYGNTPLSFAAWGGHEGVVKVLLARYDVNPEKPDSRGQTPLHCASRGGHELVVKILLERDEINPERQDNGGQTPLLNAARYGHEAVMKVLLEHDEVNPDNQDDYGDTALSLAALGGHRGVVQILLERADVNPDKPTNRGETPLQKAARGGHGEVVKMILERDQVNPNKPNDHGCTPLSLAAEYRREDVVRTLLARQEVNPEIPDNDGDTPLSCAALGGCEGVVKILLEQDRVNPDHQNNNGQTPLSIAAWQGHEGAVKILLEREVNPNTPDNDGRTPLMHAAKRGHQKVIELLQSHGAKTHGDSAIGGTMH